MHVGAIRVFLCGHIGAVVFALCVQNVLLAQEKAVSPQRTTASVPFVGCGSEGQVGPLEAPKGTSPPAPTLSDQEAQKLAYYKSAASAGVLAPRGWFCFGTYGSNGNALFVSSQPIDTAKIFSNGGTGLPGPAVEISHRYGGTSGRFEVAEIVARVFPAYKSFAADVMKEGISQPFTFGPYPKDILTYKSKTVVEYQTPAQTDGLGTHSALKKNSGSIDGVAILVGQTPPDILLLSVRLPPDQCGLASAIVRQVERDASSQLK